MSERRRETMFAAGLVAVLAAGLAFDARSVEVDPGRVRPAPGARFLARSVFCPGAVAGHQADVDLVVTSIGGGELSVGIEPQEEETVDVPARGTLMYDVGDNAPSDVVGYGAPASVGVLTTTDRPGAGAGAARCSETAHTRWYFASGSASITVDERILVYNPFPDEAVVRVSLFTPSGEQNRALLSDVPVPAQDFTVIELNEAVRVQRTLAVRVVAERGRVVAWRQMFVSDKERASGLHFSLGAPEPAMSWYFPEGLVGGGTTERISILNPNDEEAVATVTLAVGREEVLSPPDLIELAIPPRSQVNVPVGRYVEAGDEAIPVSATVRVANDVAVVAEREVVYDSDDVKGVGAELGSTDVARRWLVAPAAVEPGADAIAILNPSTEEASVTIRLLDRRGVEIALVGLEPIDIGPGGRVRIPIARWTKGRPALVFVEATAPVVAERFSVSRAQADVATIMGVPLR